jgi:hypothetical protein
VRTGNSEMWCIVNVRLVVILAIAILAYAQRSSAHTRQAVKAQEQTDSTASAVKQVTEAAEGDSRQSRDNETVMVDLPFPSLEVDPLLAEYLGLTSRQISTIQHLVSQERRETEPLMTQLQSTHEKLLTAADQGQSKETEILASTEARILTKLIIKSTRTQARLHHLLTHEQQKKLEDLNRFKSL